ncbi:MAG: helix-turn-helix domain-containing protein [Dehalococcoidia bacterium]
MDQALEELSKTLSRLGGRGEVCRRVCRALAPLVEYDARTGSDLVVTLRAYVEYGGNVATTAQRLFLHRNSVAYRLQRIEELSGIELRDRATRHVLLVALAIADPSTLTFPRQEGEGNRE